MATFAADERKRRFRRRSIQFYAVIGRPEDSVAKKYQRRFKRLRNA
jgi:hypothetical protein